MIANNDNKNNTYTKRGNMICCTVCTSNNLEIGCVSIICKHQCKRIIETMTIEIYLTLITGGVDPFKFPCFLR